MRLPLFLYAFMRYLSPLKGLNAMRAYSEKSAETKHTPSTARAATALLKHRKYSRSKPEKA